MSWSQQIRLKNETKDSRVPNRPKLYTKEFLTREKLDKANRYGFEYYFSKLTEEQKRMYRLHVEVDSKTREDAKNSKQGGQDWHRHRSWVITLSDLGYFLGHTEYVNKDGPNPVKDKVQGKKFTKQQIKRMDAGKEDEPKARAEFMKDMNKVIRGKIAHARSAGHKTIEFWEMPEKKFVIPDEVHELLDNSQDIPEDWLLEYHDDGLIIDPKHPWLGGSSDGRLTLWGLPFAMMEIKRPGTGLYILQPLSHFVQDQGNMYLSDETYLYHINWVPSKYRTNLFKFDAEMFEQCVMPLTTKIFFENLFPELCKKQPPVQVAQFGNIQIAPEPMELV